MAGYIPPMQNPWDDDADVVTLGWGRTQSGTIWRISEVEDPDGGSLSYVLERIDSEGNKSTNKSKDKKYIDGLFDKYITHEIAPDQD